MQNWLEGRNWVGKCTSNRDDRKLENTVKQSRFKHLGELHKEWTEAGVSASRVTTLRSSGKRLPSHFWNRNIVRSILPELRRKITGLLLSGPKSSFQMKVNFTFNLEIKVSESQSGEVQNPRCLKSSVKFPQSVMIWAAMSSAGVGPLWFLKSTINWWKFWSTSCFLLLTSFMEMLISFSSKTWHLPTLPKVPKAGSMTMVLLCLIGQQTRLTWTS